MGLLAGYQGCTHVRHRGVHSELCLGLWAGLYSHTWLVLSTIKTRPPAMSLPSKILFTLPFGPATVPERRTQRPGNIPKASNPKARHPVRSDHGLPKFHSFSNIANCCLPEIHKNI